MKGTGRQKEEDFVITTMSTLKRQHDIPTKCYKGCKIWCSEVRTQGITTTYTTLV